MCFDLSNISWVKMHRYLWLCKWLSQFLSHISQWSCQIRLTVRAPQSSRVDSKSDFMNNCQKICMYTWINPRNLNTTTSQNSYLTSIISICIIYTWKNCQKIVPVSWIRQIFRTVMKSTCILYAWYTWINLESWIRV